MCPSWLAIRNEDEGGQAEVVWTCHEERPRVYRKKGDGNGVTGKDERGRMKRRFPDVVKGDMGKVNAAEKNIENRTPWRNMTHRGYP